MTTHHLPGEDDVLEAAQADLSRRVTALRWVSALVPVLIVIMLLFLIPLIVDARDNSGAVRQGNDLQACRSAWNTRIVGPAQDKYDAARNQGLTLILHGLAAVGQGDDAALAVMSNRIDAEAEAIDRAGAGVATARKKYAALVHQSATNPTAFLAGCRKNGITDD